MDTPQQLKGVSAWIWSPKHTILYLPVGSINMSTAIVVVVSDGGHASITPPTRLKIMSEYKETWYRYYKVKDYVKIQINVVTII